MAGTLDVVLDGYEVTALESSTTVLRLKISGAAAPAAAYFDQLSVQSDATRIQFTVGSGSNTFYGYNRTGPIGALADNPYDVTLKLVGGRDDVNTVQIQFSSAEDLGQDAFTTLILYEADGTTVRETLDSVDATYFYSPGDSCQWQWNTGSGVTAGFTAADTGDAMFVELTDLALAAAQTFNRVDATTSVAGAVRTWEWTVTSKVFLDGGGTFAVALSGGLADDDVCTGTDFEGYMAWPYLDCGRPGAEKALEAFDIVADGSLSVSVGYDQRRGQEASATEAYALDGDTAPGTEIPLPVSGPSLQLRITFDPDQEWQWYSSNLYVNDG